MSQVYSSGEVMYLAMQIEQNGARTYRELAKRYPGLASMYEGLAADEEEHYRVFDGLRAAAGKAGAFHDDEVALMYLSQIAGSFVFDVNADPMAPFASAATPAAVYDAAILQERKSIELYNAMLEVVSGRTEKALLRRIIGQEKEHIAVLTRARDTRRYAE